MSLWTRIMMVFRIKTSAALDRAQDPRETVDYVYERHLELQRTVRRSLIDVSTSRRLLEHQKRRLEQRIPNLEDQARRAMAAGRPDLARLSLERGQMMRDELPELDQQLTQVGEEEQKLVRAEQALAGHLEAFRSRRDSLWARYTATEARVRLHQNLRDACGDLGDLNRLLERADDHASRLQARADASDGFLEPLQLCLPGRSDDVEGELRRLAAAREVDDRLARFDPTS